MSLIGKTVSISDKSLLGFLYPDFVKKDTLFFDNESNVIYVGKSKPNLKTYLENSTKSFINTVGICDIDLDIRENLTKFVYEKHNKVPKDQVIDTLNGMNPIDFNCYIKKYWVLGSSALDEDTDVNIFDLYIALTKSGMTAMKVYVKLLEHFEHSILQSSVETFFEKVAEIKDLSASGGYTRVLNEFNSKHRERLYGILDEYYTMRGSKQSKFMWLLYQF